MEEVDEDAGFPNEDVKRIVEEVCESVLENAQWDDVMVPIWQNEVIERVMKTLIDYRWPYKYVVTCMLVHKTDKPLQSSCSMCWESNNDGYEAVIYPAIKNKESFQKSL